MDHFQDSEFLTDTGSPITVGRLPDKDCWGSERVARWIARAVQDNPHRDARTPLTPGYLQPEPGPMPAHTSPASAGSSSHAAAESFGAAALAFDFDRFLQMLDV
ncbi:hypothetical protein PP716_23085 [Ralstonia solanacearum]|nr:hypothetical protein [Ralstonia solanacearum]